MLASENNRERTNIQNINIALIKYEHSMVIINIINEYIF